MQMELMMDLRGLLIEIEEIPVPTPVVGDNRVHLLHGAIVLCNNLDSVPCSASSLRGLETIAQIVP